MQQSIDRSGGIHGNKGTEAAIAAINGFYSSASILSHEYKKPALLTSGQLQIEVASKIEE
jgi:6,7-dimethyl-8-ribityllumazine synthase